MRLCRRLDILESYRLWINEHRVSILLIGNIKRTFLNRNYYGSKDVLFGCLGVSKGQGNETENTKTDKNNIYLI